jgi:uncharacterized membrane-anchored protein YitT (DUF2179 family)/heme-degrading monooxygenase HmoA
LHIIAWRFVVKPEFIDEFKREYGPDGSWAQLFALDSGYVRTELTQHRDTPNEFVTIDYWKTREDFDRFKSQYAEAYQRLDGELARLTTHEERISRTSRPEVAAFRRELANAAFVVAGVFSAGLGLKGFLLPSGFIDGGVTGVSLLLARVTNLPLSLWLPIINVPFVAVGYRQLGRAFAVRSSMAIVTLAVVVAVVDYPSVTRDLVLTAIFGGFFLGAGIGLAMRGGAVLDGTEIAALLISKGSAMIRVGDVILGFNVVLFVVAMAVLGVEAALYSIVTYLAAARTVDFVVHGIEEYTAMTIISSESAAIREAITGVLGRGVTVHKGYGGLTNIEHEILYCVVTRLEIGKIKSIVRGIDENAFIVSHALSDVDGGVVKKTALHIEK